MNDEDNKDEQAFEEWFRDYWSFEYVRPDCLNTWHAACDYMRNRSPLDPVSLYDKLEKERERSEILVEALEKFSLYVSYNGDTWVKERATEALKKYRGEA